MKYHELLYETIDTDNINCIIQQIVKNCQPFLTQINYNLPAYNLYRGIKNTSQIYDGACEFLKIIPGHDVNRIPRNTPKELHHLINQNFEKTFHYPFRNGIFVSGLYDSALFYGKVHTIIPIGAFHFLWSKQVYDLFSEWHDFKELNNIPINSNAAPIDVIKAFSDRFDQNNYYQYQTDNLKEAILYHNEIMVYCNKCFALDISEPNVVQAFAEIFAHKKIP